jgi:hypothetical protein
MSDRPQTWTLSLAKLRVMWIQFCFTGALGNAMHKYSTPCFCDARTNATA